MTTSNSPNMTPSKQITDIQGSEDYCQRATTDNKILNDSWVCPVAVALRQAGFDVPLRPSKSWLEKDRKKHRTRCSRTDKFIS